ncbi:RagB/SusD family nutrient uptake outer membrane protein [Fulvivirga sp. M361]|uniref:RagB/SusD family nutrient uptake outer membrane protein n=1 Tax=Fulvivirga sp. M361 TaxID=2594266 RepID=UPI00117ACF69|nr:RagB/SusD family nutrient uptake outer membrane protein [Fulvivirga sp. M361]TRX49033.1 RagB/SusD family nutrient uptake outer membrane protein [Fulvivirga sp. M361]
MNELIKMKFNKLNVAIILLSIMVIGCDDYLDVTPESVWESASFYSTPQEAEIALAGIYGVLASDESYGREQLILGAGTDEYYYNRRFNENWAVSLFRNTPADQFSFNYWTNQYQAINLANLFIESIDRSSFETEEAFNALVAEVRFLRALCYFNLSNYWNEVPLRLSSSKDQEDNNVPPAPLADVYDAIVEDFTFASENLPHPVDAGYVQGRAHKLAAHGLLARVYMKMSGYPFKQPHYQEAITHCEAVINDGFHSLITTSDTTGYREVFLDVIGGVYNMTEVIFEISFQNLRDQGLTGTTVGRLGALNGLNFGSNNNLGDPNGFAQAGVYPILSGLYDQNNDKRYLWNIATFKRTGAGDIIRVTNEMATRDFCPAKYKRWEPLDYADIDIEGTNENFVILENSASELNRNFTSVNFPVLRYSDILLMYAEASNELNNGPSALAIEYLNEVRNRAGLVNIEVEKPTVAADKVLFFDELVDERTRELCFEGVRRHDLIRWELLDEKLAEVKAFVEGHPDFVASNADHQAALRGPNNFDVNIHLSLPYPLVEVTVNQSLDQKPEWQ